MAKKSEDKLYVIRKYIYAKSVGAAMRKEKISPVDDCYLDEDCKRSLVYKENDIGF